MNRREFIGAACGGVGALALGGSRASAAPARATHLVGGAMGRTLEIRKALKYGMIGEGETIAEKLAAAKAAGFDGVEMDSPNGFEPAEVLAARDAAGIVIPGVVDSVHWRDTLSHPDAEVRARGLEGLQTALRDAKAYGATTVLLVPAVVNKEVSYADAYSRSQAEIRKAIPLAQELGVKIAFENVWNNFLLSPLEAARYVDEFESPMVGWYFDIGNIVNYGWPAHWIRTLGDRILKLDIKDFSRGKRDNEGLWKGFGVKIGEGDADWAEVRAALAEIGYSGWATAEVGGGDAARLREIARRMDEVLDIN